MDILAKARRLESSISDRFDKAAKSFVRSERREPLEIVHAILDVIEKEVQPGGRGTRVFPFTSIKLSLLAPLPEARARLESVIAGHPTLHARVVERLKRAGCATSGIDLDVAYAPHAHDGWRAPEFDVEFARTTDSDAMIRPTGLPAERIDLTVIRGETDEQAYSIASERIDLGRGAEVRDTHNRLIRTNHVAFKEGAGEVNQSVSRQHAHISWKPDKPHPPVPLTESSPATASHPAHFRLHDDGSLQGTGIVREGRTVPVPHGSRGVLLRSGDEIVLGEARVRVTISESGT
ncbi:MAG TPA: FHA domain-containing protein [Vicinamibacterales bacterium]|jgi:hypothetical protein|nr:FHA domain-containing protein [Vicinamibacterales bacterium]